MIFGKFKHEIMNLGAKIPLPPLANRSLLLPTKISGSM